MEERKRNRLPTSRCRGSGRETGTRGQRRTKHGVEHMAGGARASRAWPVAVTHARGQRPGGQLDGGSD
jgi:hypothetical protein